MWPWWGEYGVGFEVSKPLAIYSQVARHYACCHFPVMLMDSNRLEQKAQIHISFYKLPRLWCCTIAMEKWWIHTQNLIFIFLFPSFLRPSLLLPRLALTLLCSWVWPWTSELPTLQVYTTYPVSCVCAVGIHMWAHACVDVCGRQRSMPGSSQLFYTLFSLTDYNVISVGSGMQTECLHDRSSFVHLVKLKA